MLDNRLRTQVVPCCVLVGGLAAVTASADWGNIAIDNTGNRSVTFENSIFIAKYDYFSDSHGEHAIRILGLKNANPRINLAGSHIDACATRPELSGAVVISDNADRKTARLTWGSVAVADITIYPDMPFLKIAYQKNGVNVVDITNAGGNYVIYGSESWKREIGDMAYPKCYFHRGDSHCAEQNGETGSSDDPRPLLYNGWFILGLHHANGQGYGRVMPSTVDIVKLLPFGNGNGFEFFWREYTGYLFVATGGASDILSTGKGIIDWANAGENGLPALDATRSRPVAELSAASEHLPSVRARHHAGALHLSIEALGTHSVRVLRVDGSELLCREGDGAVEYTVNGCAPGAYVISLQASGHDHTRRVIVKAR